jgi:cyclic-di-AMP phosphodiesterase PgpH
MKIKQIKLKLVEQFDTGRMVRLGLLAAITTIFALVVYPGLFIKGYDYKVGDVVDKDIKAPRDFFVEDTDATEINRRKAIASVLTVYDHDIKLVDRLCKKVMDAFSPPRRLVEEHYRTEELHHAPPSTSSESPTPGSAPLPLSEKLIKLKPAFEARIGFEVSNDAFDILEKEGFSERITDLITNILTQIMKNGVVSNKETLLREAENGFIIRDVDTQSERIENDLKKLYGSDQSKAMVRIIGEEELNKLNYNLRNLVVDFIQALIQPNITLNRNETEARKRTAAMESRPVLTKIKAGEMLLREGERVTELQVAKLNALEARHNIRRVAVAATGAALLMLCLYSVLYRLVCHQRQCKIDQNKDLIFLAVLFVIALLIARVAPALSKSFIGAMPIAVSETVIWQAAPIAAGAMTVSLFLGIEIAAAFAIAASLAAAVIMGDRFDMFLYYLISSIMGSIWVSLCRERKVFIKGGAKLGLLNMGLATAVTAYSGEISGFNLILTWVFSFLGGITSGIVTAGFAPLMEMAFRYTTDIKLLELANLDQPILKQLMIEAPGTYHHSVIVGSMVEAAAAEIGANPLLAKVCGYYHDIGKAKKPLYFIENQTDGKNRHDKLAPSMSALILISHVKHGVEIAKSHRLGQPILDTIRQHHGTSLIQYFFERAKQRLGEDGVNIADFRYPGPKPQTRETGLVMLADIVEAASRTLDNPTPSRIQGLVQTLMNKVFSDGQLDNCELTLKDLHSIAKSFNKILNGIHHHRIEYPEKSATTAEKTKNGHSDRQPAKPIAPIRDKSSESSSGHLKRLGIS